MKLYTDKLYIFYTWVRIAYDILQEKKDDDERKHTWLWKSYLTTGKQAKIEETAHEKYNDTIKRKNKKKSWKNTTKWKNIMDERSRSRC